MIVQTLPDRFWNKVQKASDDSCWIWLAGKDQDGYGMYSHNKKTIRAHRLLASVVYGEIKSGFVVMHSCDNPSCCNPRHLSIGSVQENVSDRDKKGRRDPPKGESHKSSKITALQAQEIRSSTLTERELAKKYAIGKTQVGAIRRGLYWR